MIDVLAQDVAQMKLDVLSSVNLIEEAWRLATPLYNQEVLSQVILSRQC
jgi:hypothetical protein